MFTLGLVFVLLETSLGPSGPPLRPFGSLFVAFVFFTVSFVSLQNGPFRGDPFFTMKKLVFFHPPGSTDVPFGEAEKRACAFGVVKTNGKVTSAKLTFWTLLGSLSPTSPPWGLLSVPSRRALSRRPIFYNEKACFFSSTGSAKGPLGKLQNRHVHFDL